MKVIVSVIIHRPKQACLRALSQNKLVGGVSSGPDAGEESNLIILMQVSIASSQETVTLSVIWKNGCRH